MTTTHHHTASWHELDATGHLSATGYGSARYNASERPIGSVYLRPMLAAAIDARRQHGTLVIGSPHASARDRGAGIRWHANWR